MVRQGAGVLMLATGLCCGSLGVAAAGAQQGSGGEVAGDEPPELRLQAERANPRKKFWAGGGKVRFRFRLAGQRSRDVRVEAVKRRSGEVGRRWRLEGVPPGEAEAVRWNGSRKGSNAPNGDYFFRVLDERGRKADRSRSKGRRKFRLYDHRAPIRARHSYGDGVGAGRNHQGQDLFARCGAKVFAARAGRVKHRAYQSSAGHYVVIAGKATSRDYVYMHLKRRSPLKPGQRVRTGQAIGRVGASGNASGCHLHFELWSGPGWYEGGKPLRSVTRKLRKWDRWERG